VIKYGYLDILRKKIMEKSIAEEIKIGEKKTSEPNEQQN
jgi:hypothetical protein